MADEILKLESTSTLSESVEAHMRHFSQSTVHRRNRLIGLIGAPVIFYIIFRNVSNGDISAFLIATFCSVLYIIGYLALNDIMTKRQLRSMIIESRGTKDPILVNEQLTEEGMIIQNDGTELTLPWKKLTKITEDETYIELKFGKEALVLWVKKKFQSEEQMKTWIHFAREKSGLDITR